LIASSFWNNVFSPAMAKAGVRCRFHDLRHISVALAIAAGAHPKAIQTRMGHSSINVTLDRYGHLFPELDEALAYSFGERLETAPAGRRTSNVVHASFSGQRDRKFCPPDPRCSRLDAGVPDHPSFRTHPVQHGDVDVLLDRGDRRTPV
jgi:hypothetical protein